MHSYTCAHLRQQVALDGAALGGDHIAGLAMAIHVVHAAVHVQREQRARRALVAARRVDQALPAAQPVRQLRAPEQAQGVSSKME